jgi:hypothetical protein
LQKLLVVEVHWSWGPMISLTMMRLSSIFQQAEPVIRVLGPNGDPSCASYPDRNLWIWYA